MATVDKILKKVKMLQPISPIIHKILALTEDPDCSMDDLVHLLEHDPAATANLLRICNSVYLGFKAFFTTSACPFLRLSSSFFCPFLFVAQCGGPSGSLGP
jgi:hypothetical protein